MELIKRVQYLTSAHRTLSKQEIKEVKALDEISHARCREQATKLVRAQPGLPILMVYMNDAWSCRCRETTQHRVDEDCRETEVHHQIRLKIENKNWKHFKHM